MKYLQKSFSIYPGLNKNFYDNYDTIFRKSEKEEVKTCAFCGQEEKDMNIGICKWCWTRIEQQEQRRILELEERL